MKDYLTLCCREQWQDGLFCHVMCEGDTLRLSAAHYQGACCLPPVDSREKGFSWSRLRIGAELPQDCGLRVYIYCSDNGEWSVWEELRDAFQEAKEENITAILQACFGPPLPPGTDCLLRASGRYLWIAFELTATGEQHPFIEAISLRMGGDHMIDYLPSIYRDNDFTWRFLSIYNSMMQDMEDAVEAMPGQLNAESAGEGMLDYLARWVCVEPGEGSPQDAQDRMRTALDEYETMYTPEGVKRSVQRLTGQTPLLIEHFMVDPNQADCRNPALYRRLYGDNPYRFFVLLHEDTFASRDKMEWFLGRMRELIPAETELELILLKQCVQLDWHTYLGVNSRIGSYIPAVIDETVTIHYDTTIGGTTT